jgi:hypothetical protein
MPQLPKPGDKKIDHKVFSDFDERIRRASSAEGSIDSAGHVGSFGFKPQPRKGSGVGSSARHPFQIFVGGKVSVESDPTSDWRCIKVFQGTAFQQLAWQGAEHLQGVPVDDECLVLDASQQFIMIYGEMTGFKNGTFSRFTIKAKNGKDLLINYPQAQWMNSDTVRFLIGVCRTSTDELKQLQIVQLINDDIDEVHPSTLWNPFRMYSKHSSDTAFIQTAASGSVYGGTTSNADTISCGTSSTLLWIKITFNQTTRAVTAVEYQSGAAIPTNPTPTGDGLTVPYLYINVGSVQASTSYTTTAFTETVPTSYQLPNVVQNGIDTDARAIHFVDGYLLSPSGISVSVNTAILRQIL